MKKDFDRWNKDKQKIHGSIPDPEEFFSEREIWWCALGCNVGDEEDGKNYDFERPVLIVKKFNRQIVLAVPISTKNKDNPYYFPFKHDGITFSIMISQLRLLSTKRFLRRIRKIDHNLFSEIKNKIVEMILKRTNPVL